MQTVAVLLRRLEPQPAYGLLVAKRAARVLLVGLMLLPSAAACAQDRLDSTQEMVASGECGEEIERRFGRTNQIGAYDIDHSDGTTFFRFFPTQESNSPSYSCEVVKDEAEPNGFRVVDVFRGG